MTVDTRKAVLLDQQLALSAYLDALLNDGGTAAPETAPATGTQAVTDTVVAAERSPATVSETRPGVPDWARAPFPVLLFEVAGLTLAVPLIKLKGVVPGEGDTTPMPGHSPLFLGVMPYQGMQSRVVDLARLVLPADRLAALEQDVHERTRQRVMIDDGRWALACSTIGNVIELEAKDVKWRSAAGKRPWLAGTVIDKMCALLDTDALAQMLADGVA